MVGVSAPLTGDSHDCVICDQQLAILFKLPDFDRSNGAKPRRLVYAR